MVFATIQRLWAVPLKSLCFVKTGRRSGSALLQGNEASIRTIRTVQVSVVATTYKGQPSTLAVIRDITEKKRAEAEIVRLNQELEQKVRDLRNANEELEAFNFTLSHDLHTPLMVIKGFCKRISKKYARLLDEKFIEQMGTIHASAQRMEQLINDLPLCANISETLSPE
jgi:signal transduction histidine kinase